MAGSVEEIKPYEGDSRQKGEQVRDMFDNIAPAYDFMNRAMTLGVDTLWRRKAVSIIASHLKGAAVDAPKVLDVATGTGDMALLLARSLRGATVTGVDLSEGMIAIGRDKVDKAGMGTRVSLQVADCLSLPLPDNEYDCVTVAYGVRNFERLAYGYRQMLRVLKPGGLLCVIELSTPTNPLVRPLYHLYTRHAIPLAGRLVSRDVRAYTYLPESIAAVAQGPDMCRIISEAGFAYAAYKPLTLGVCTIYTARKP